MRKYAAYKLKEMLQKPTCGKNLLHNLHRQLSEFHSFIFNLSFSKLLLF